MPRGLPVGTAVKGLDGRWRVVLAADKSPIDFVRVLLFQDFTQLVNQKELAEKHVPPPTLGATIVGVAPVAAPPATAKPAATAAAKAPATPAATLAATPAEKTSAPPAAKPTDAKAPAKTGAKTTTKRAAKPATPKPAAKPAATSGDEPPH
jgi:rod shape-determining protein MreC